MERVIRHDDNWLISSPYGVYTMKSCCAINRLREYCWKPVLPFVTYLQFSSKEPSTDFQTRMTMGLTTVRSFSRDCPSLFRDSDYIYFRRLCYYVWTFLLDLRGTPQRFYDFQLVFESSLNCLHLDLKSTCSLVDVFKSYPPSLHPIYLTPETLVRRPDIRVVKPF